jgi:hypothetical protein
LIELAMTLRDVEEERRILDVAIRFLESVERFLVLAERVVLIAALKRCPRLGSIVGVRARGRVRSAPATSDN